MIETLILIGAGCCIAGLVAGCATSGEPSGSVEKNSYGQTADGKSVELITLRNDKGSEAQIITYGGIVTSLKVPDKSGKMGDVVLGCDNLEGYEKATTYFGALIGRYGNRIAGGKFSLDGATYTLPKNNAPNCLHGGVKSFDKQVWQIVRTQATNKDASVELSYFSKDGEEGFPGNLKVNATYTLTEDNALRVEFKATTDKATVVNLTHHSYFNLAGGGDILNHEITINADKFTPVDATLIPTGELKPVKGTPFDFIAPHTVGERINATDEQLKLGRGYDHNWVINKKADELGFVARAYEASSGRVMEVYSTEPGTQFYTGNFLDGSVKGKGQTYQFRTGLCFEPQHFPDSPNHPAFPSTVLRPGQTFKNAIIYKFSVR